MDYKIIIYGKGLYREVPFKESFASGIFMGTGKEAQLKFIKSHFGVEFWINVEKQDEKWRISSSDTVRLKSDYVKRGEDACLMPGEVVHVYDADKELFCLDFSVDFGEEGSDYNKRIDCRDVKAFQIGGLSHSTIRILCPVIAEDEISLVRQENGYLISTDKCRYGVYVNGCLTKEKTVSVRKFDFFSLDGCCFYIEGDWLYISENMPLDTQLYVEAVHSVKNHLQYPKFIRSVRQLYESPQEKLDILPPKQMPEEPQTSLVMTIVPLLASLILTVVMRGMMGRSGIFMLYCVGTMALSGAMAVWNYKTQSKKYKERVEKRRKKYEEYLMEQEEKIQAVREKERLITRQKDPMLEEQLGFIEDFDARLFEKQRQDLDFLSCSLGKGTVESACQVEFKEQEYKDTEDPLTEYPGIIHEKYQYLSDMPIMLSLKEYNAVGLVGNRGKLYQMAKNITLTLAAAHYYNDARFFYILKEEDTPYFSWARWLRHTVNDKLHTRNFMYDEESCKILLEYLYAELSRREGMDKSTLTAKEPYFVIFVYRSEYISVHPITHYIEKARELGIVFLFFEEYVEFLNKDCNVRIFLENNKNEGYIQAVENGECIQRFTYPHVTGKRAADAALRLGCVYVEEVSLESTLTKNISLFKLLHINSVYDLKLEQRWNTSRIYDSMAAPLGVKSGNEVVYLDLHEKYHGPHGLVAGTTGSGKSEILQSYILSMATLFHPYEVGFIIIDFKGGGMVNQFKNLPHLNGAITNIDGREIDRSLLSIRAELRKRQELFAKYEVNHIDDYIRLFKNGKADIPLPHLILIVDEFAELKSEQPEFMKELISAARIGRSLGVHLILATQKPAGVVNDQIWSNSRFKLCLKVQNKEDSNEVLKSPLAAEIREPGRAYLQVGNNEIFQLFQSAYSGASVPSESMGAVKAFKVNKVDLAGRRSVIYEQKPPKDTSGVTQLDALVSYIDQFCREKGIQKLQDICLPALPYKIPYSQKDFVPEGENICVPVGYYDDPAKQEQTVMSINLTQNHVYIVGSSQYGKTNLLQTVIRGVAERYSPQEVSLYILDFAGMLMKNFETLLHVGGVITVRDDEKLKNFLKMMLEEMEHRKNVLAEMGLSSFGAYRESGYRDMPQIVIMADNFGAVRELFPKYEESLLRICRDGIAVGICVMATTSQAAAVGYKYLAAFGKRIALFCNESSEYAHAFEHCRIKADNKPGRCLLELSREIYEGQLYLAFEAEKEIEKIEQIRIFIEECNGRNKGRGAKKIPELPTVVTEEFINRQTGGEYGRYEIVSGVNYTTTELEYLRMLQSGIVGVSGKEHVGVSNFLQYLTGTMIKRKEREPVQVHIIDDIRRKLEDFKQYEEVEYSYQPEDAVRYLKELAAVLDERYKWMVSGQESRLEDAPMQVILLNAEECYSILGNDSEVMEAYGRIISKYRTLKFCIIMAKLPNASINFSPLPMVRGAKDSINLYMFYNLSEQKMIEIPLSVQREFAKQLNVGDAFAVYAGNLEKIKTPLYERNKGERPWHADAEKSGSAV